MAQREKVVSINIMDDDVVCISDDEERQDGGARSIPQAQRRVRNPNFHHNEYENIFYMPESVRARKYHRPKNHTKYQFIHGDN